MGYQVYRGKVLVRTTEGAAELEFQDTNLFAHMEYEYQVAAVSRQGARGPLTAPKKVKMGPPGPPSAPRDLRCLTDGLGDGKVAVSVEWNPPSDCGGAPVTEGGFHSAPRDLRCLTDGL